MEIVDAYELVGSYRGAAELCGTSHKTVKRVIERREVGQPERRAVVGNTAGRRTSVVSGRAVQRSNPRLARALCGLVLCCSRGWSRYDCLSRRPRIL
jgi:hypothetical protein